MADTVRYFLEDMVPELEDLEENGYFSKPELREVIRRRENFEYALKRRPPLKADFLRYIDYERSLSELLHLRAAGQGIEVKKSRGTVGITSRCHLLYERATRKFRGDLQLWLAWLEFCKETSSTRQLSKVITKALQLHPTVSGLWIFAASWEFEHNKNTATARSLMQRGLRICKADEQLWLEYLRMELIYAQKLRLRRKILGIEPAARQEKRLEEEGVPEPEEPEGNALEAVLCGGVAKVVAKEAITRIPDSLKFRVKLLELIKHFGGQAGIDSLAAEILQGIEEDFGESEEAWDLRARQASGLLASSSSPEAVEASIAIFEKALASVQTTKMFDLYLAFLNEQIWGSRGNGQSDGELSRSRLKGKERKAAKRALELYRRAADLGLLSEAAALERAKLELQCGRVVEALAAAESATQLHPTSAKAWVQRIALLQQYAAAQQVKSEQEASIAALQEAVSSACQAVESSREAEVWRAAFAAFQELHIPSKTLQLHLQLSLASCKPAGFKDAMGPVAAEIVHLVREEDGIEAARGFYAELLKLPPCGSGFLHGVLDMELKETDQPLPPSRIQALFEAAVAVNGREDVELWRKYAAFEEKQGNGSSTVYWKATKMLDCPDDFINRI